MNELTTHIQENMPLCMLLAHNIVLVDESRNGMSAKLKNGGRLHNLKQVVGRQYELQFQWVCGNKCDSCENWSSRDNPKILFQYLGFIKRKERLKSMSSIG